MQSNVSENDRPIFSDKWHSPMPFYFSRERLKMRYREIFCGV